MSARRYTRIAYNPSPRERQEGSHLQPIRRHKPLSENPVPPSHRLPETAPSFRIISTRLRSPRFSLRAYRTRYLARDLLSEDYLRTKILGSIFRDHMSWIDDYDSDDGTYDPSDDPDVITDVVGGLRFAGTGCFDQHRRSPTEGSLSVALGVRR